MNGPIPLRRRITGLAIAAVTGVAIDGGLLVVRGWVANLATVGSSGGWPPPSLGLLYLGIGSLVAVPACLLVGLPLWHRAERRGRRGRGDAVRTGAIAGGAIGLTMGAIDVADGLSTWWDDTASFNAWAWGVQVIADGMPTPAGWLFELLDLAGYCIAGIGAGLVARRVALCGESSV